MVRTAVKIVFLAALVLAGAAGIYIYSGANSDARQIAELRRETEQLQQIVSRLSAERRIAQVLVTDQQRDDAGILVTTLLFVEETRDGRTLPPKQIVVRGDHAYIDALVIKFDKPYLESGDALRGQSIALFDKIFGSAQAPDDATRIDTPGRIPEIYRNTDPVISQFEQSLWDQFWELAANPAQAAQAGVRVAHGQSVYGPFESDKLYILTIETNGNISMTAQPVPAVYREAMRR